MTTTIDPIDTLSARLAQARATLTFVLSDGDDGERFRTRHDLVVNALWSVEELLDQARSALDAHLASLEQTTPPALARGQSPSCP